MTLSRWKHDCFAEMMADVADEAEDAAPRFHIFHNALNNATNVTGYCEPDKHSTQL